MSNAAAVNPANAGPVIPPVDFVSPQLSLKAMGTGLLLGGTLSICNVYTGLKIGWGLNMSITGILLAFAFWSVLSKLSAGRVGMMNKLENNINQASCSAAGSVSSAGLVSAIPALTMIEGIKLEWWQLTLWMASVCLVGIAVAMGLRRQMVIRDQLPFPGGIACAETLKEIYGAGAEALKRVGVLAGAGVVAGLVKVAEIKKWVARSDLGATINGSPAATYSFALDPTLLMVAVGGLVGFRACVSLMLGAILSWGVIATQLVNNGTVAANRGPIGEWLLWPGVTLMVVSSLVSFSFSAPAILRSFRRTSDPDASGGTERTDTGEVSRPWFIASLTIALIATVALQIWFFGISWWAAIFAVLLSFALAVVASRVSGETNVTPVGAMGKVTQFAFAVIAPKQAAANLMSASVTAGAASQCADLMHDLKCGYLLGAVARKQVVGQMIGAMAGAIVGSAFYLVLVPDPAKMLLTDEWPAPAVAMWKSVAEVFHNGISTLPAGATSAMAWAALAGVLLPVLEKMLSTKARVWVPSAASMGLAFVIPANNSISMFIGGVLALALGKLFPTWTGRFFVTVCAGVVAGESLVGAGDALRLVLMGGK
jgi:OPT family oligopeptide transporter